MDKRIFTFLGFVGAVVLATTAIFLATPHEATARTACNSCTCDGPLTSTPMVWGSGATCTEAFNDGLAQSRALQNCADGVCFEQVIIDAACWSNGTHYMVDMHTDYRCYVCTLKCVAVEADLS